MSHWEYADLERLLDEYIGPTDTSDPKVRKRMRILEAATALFIEQGYRKTSVDEVADKAGVAKGTVYLYFKGKIDLILAAIAMEEHTALSRLKAIFVEPMDARVRLRRYIETTLALIEEMPLTLRLMGGDHEYAAVLAEMPPALRRRNDEAILGFLGGMVDEAAAPHRWNRVEIEDRARVLASLWFFGALLHGEEVRGGLPLDRFAAIFAELVVDGLGPRRDGASKGD